METLVPDEILTAEQLSLEQKSDPSAAIARLLQNPGGLIGMLNLSPEQARNMKALSVGIASAFSVKYLGKSVGDVPAAAVGSIVAALIAKKVFG